MYCMKNLIPLRDYCRENEWPRIAQWNHWIFAKKPIAIKCIKKVGGRYLLDIEALKNYIKNSSLEE